MSNTPVNQEYRLQGDDEFVTLTMAHLDGLLNEAQVAKLNVYLRNDPEKRGFFVDLCLQARTLREVVAPEHSVRTNKDAGIDQESWSLLESVLEQERVARLKREAEAALEKQQQATRDAERRASMRMLAGLSKPDAGSQTRHYVIPRPVFYGGIAAVVAVAAAIIWPMIDPQTTPDNANRGPQFIEVATLVEEFEAKWEQGSHRIAVGEAVFNEKIMLTEGFAKLRFKDEAEVILEAPCEFEPVSETELRITRGKLIAQCRTQASKGFVVRAGNARIVDLGTEFGVTVAEDRTLEAHVIEGEVTLTPLVEEGSRQAIQLTAGAAKRVSPDATQVDEIPVDQYQFVRGMTPEDRDPMRGYVGSVKSLNPVVYYRFEHNENQTFENEGSGPYPGPIAGSVLVEKVAGLNVARFGGFEQPGYVRIRRTIGELRSAPEYSVECWIKPDSFQAAAIWSMNEPFWTEDNLLNSCAGVMIQQSNEPNSPQWSELLRMVHRSEPSDRSGETGVDLVTKKPYVPGQWMHVVVVKSRTHARLFINGQLANEVADSTPFADVDFGTSLGHHGVQPARREDHSRRYAGLMDEFAIYTRALTNEEINEHYSRMAPLLVE